MCAAIRTILSGQSDPVRPERSGHEPRLVLDAMQGRMPPPIETRLAAKQHVLVRAPEDDDDMNHCRCAGHHAIHARSVLGTVQGSALRFDRARARTAGVDGACAQTAGWAL